MELCDGYKVQVQEFGGHRFVAIRRFYSAAGEHRAGVPGFNLNPFQWSKLKHLRSQLVHAAINRHDVVVKLGLEKAIEVKKGTIWLKRIPEDCSEEFMNRNSVPLRPRLWRELWRNAEWIDKELREDSPESEEYELDPEGCKHEEGTAVSPAPTEDVKDTSLMDLALRIDETDNATAAPWPHFPGNIPQQDSDLTGDPQWYRLRAYAPVSGSNGAGSSGSTDNGGRKRKPLFTLRRQDAMLPKLPKME